MVPATPVAAGLPHNGVALTLDVLWLDFSNFGLTQSSTDADSVEELTTDFRGQGVQYRWIGTADLSSVGLRETASWDLTTQIGDSSD